MQTDLSNLALIGVESWNVQSFIYFLYSHFTILTKKEQFCFYSVVGLQCHNFKTAIQKYRRDAFTYNFFCSVSEIWLLLQIKCHEI